MFNIKSMMYKMMIDCDKSTYYSNKSQYQKLNFKEKIKLDIHLFACKPCRTYDKQSAIITEKIAQLEEIGSNGKELSMKAEKKDEIKNEIAQNVKEKM